jgi:hypothetical protein
MTEDHHRIRDFVVLELPQLGKPIPAEHIGENLDLPMDRVLEILDELERNMTFLFRYEEGAVSWAYPVTAEVTPPSDYLQHWGTDLRRLSGRRDCDALRAGAIA